MADSKQADHWDLLASVLGAEPEKKEPGQPIWQAEEKKPETAEDIIIDDIIEDIIKDADAKASEAKSPSMAESPVEPAATSSPPPISTWDALAMELGIEVKPETARAPAPMRMSAPKQAEKKTAVRSEHQQEPFRQATAEFGERIEPFGISEPSSAEEPQEQREKKSHRRRRRHRKDRDTGHPGAKMEESSFGSQRDAPLEEDVFVSEASLETADKSVQRSRKSRTKSPEKDTQNTIVRGADCATEGKKGPKATGKWELTPNKRQPPDMMCRLRRAKRPRDLKAKKRLRMKTSKIGTSAARNRLSAPFPLGKKPWAAS